MSTPGNKNSREVNELLQQLKDLHAPHRCEGPGNFLWHGIQRLTNIASSKKTDQQKITDHWNAKELRTKRSELKKLASTELHDFYSVCREVDKDRAVAFYTLHQEVWDTLSSEIPEELETKQGDVDNFIDKSFAPGVQKMFDIMIVQWAWRRRMRKAWFD